MGEDEYKAQVERLEAETHRLQEEARARQSGQDRRINDLQQEIERGKEALRTQELQNREIMLRGLPEAEQLKLQQQWDYDDRKRELDDYASEVQGYHGDVEVAHLLYQYRGVPGVTEEALLGMAQEEREGFCKDRRIEQLEAQQSGVHPDAAQPAANGNGTAPQSAPEAPPAAAPAGATAPSDVGGTGVPPARPQRNTEQSLDAMTENISTHGWVSGKFSVPRRG